MSKLSNDHAFVVPVYKDCPYLEECITSLLNQVLPTKVVITTATPSSYIENLANKYSLPYYVSEKPPLVYNNWNFAIEKSGTRYVTIAHADDMYDKNYTKEVLSLLERKQKNKPLITFTDYVDIVKGKEKRSSLNNFIKNLLLFPFYFNNSIGNKFIKKSVLSLGNPICCPSVTIDRENLEDVAFSDRFPLVLDWDLWLRLAEKDGHFLFVNKKLTKHRIHTETLTTHGIKSGKMRMEEAQIFKSIYGNFLGNIISTIYTKGYNNNQL